MILINIVLVCVSTFLVQDVVGEPPKFRIIAPAFICPEDKDALIDKPDTTTITFQTEPGVQMEFDWIVRWHPLVAPTQQFTLALWNTVRELESRLKNQRYLLNEENVFFIKKSQLLAGVKYIFNVTGRKRGEDDGTQKTFEIDFSKRDPKLLIEGQSDMFSVILIGAELAYVEIDYTVEAQVTTCLRTQDYYFMWILTSGNHKEVVPDIKGSHLVLRGRTLNAGQSYEVLCQVYKYSNGEFITQDSLPFRVLHRTISINFNVELLVVPTRTPFEIYTDVKKMQFKHNGKIFTWTCLYDGESCTSLYEANDEFLNFPYGLLDEGEYLITVEVLVLDQIVKNHVVLQATGRTPKLPVIDMIPMSKVLNEGTIVTFKANISGVLPGCSITWFFKSHYCLTHYYSSSMERCADNRHGLWLSEPINFYSREANFLSELTDYTNESRWKSVSASMTARAGRVTVVAKCECMKGENCTGDGEVYADVMFQLNHRPELKSISVSFGNPMQLIVNNGTAMETVFRLSTGAALDTTRPLRYSFYADLATNDTLLLGSYMEFMAIETMLPYIEGGTFVKLEVCDALGACTTGESKRVFVEPGEARTIDALIEDVRAHVTRCELMALRPLAASAIVTYTNANQTEAFTKFTTSLLNALEDIDDPCVAVNYEELQDFFYWLQRAGIDIPNLM